MVKNKDFETFKKSCELRPQENRGKKAIIQGVFMTNPNFNLGGFELPKSDTINF